MNRRGCVKSLLVMFLSAVATGLRADECLLYSVNIDGTGLKVQVPKESCPEFKAFGSPDFSPDGRKLIFDATPTTGFKDARLLVITLTGPTKGEIEDMDCGNAPAWSPDGKRIAFEVCSGNPKGFQQGVWMMNADGSDPVRLADGEYPRWHPSGESVICENNTASPSISQMQVDIETREATPFLNTYIHRSPIRWSPDGKKVLAVIQDDNKTQLVTVSPEGDRESLVKLAEGQIQFPIFSPDGQSVAYSIRQNQDEKDLYIVAVDGKSKPRKVDFAPEVHKEDLCWSKDGKRILFSARSKAPLTTKE